MSVRGLYESDAGDRMARLTLAPYRKIDNSEIDDEAPRVSNRPRRMCACGGELVRPYIQRNGVNVCRECAAKTPRMQGGHKAKFRCVKCKQILPRLALVVRKGKLYCRDCAKGL